MNSKKHFEVVAAVIKKDDKIFCCQRGPKGECAFKWEFPGGKQEEGETLQQTLQRELQEELGIETIVGDFFMQSIYDYDFGQVQINCFWVKLCDETAFVCSNEHEDTAWIDLNELKN